MENTKPKIAFLGIGLMGLPMSTILVKNGFNVTAWNRSPQKLTSIVELGATEAKTPADAVKNADIVITMLQNGDIVDDILLTQGVAKSMKKGALLIDMSSIAPLMAQKHGKLLADLGLKYLDAPVSGGTKGATDGTLVIMAGGNDASFDAAQIVFNNLGRAMLIGPVGSGQLSKLANQTIVAITIAAVSEGLLLASAGGADPALVRECLLGGFADSRILKEHGYRMVTQDFVPGGTNKVFIKDLKTVLLTAKHLGLDLPIVKYVLEVYIKMVEGDYAELDHASYIIALEEENQPHKLVS